MTPRTIEDIVRDELEHNEKTRNSDRLLIMNIYHRYGVSRFDKFDDVIMDENLPSVETIRRCRQKLQEHHEELRAVKEVEDKRIERQQTFLDYALSY